MAWLKKGTAHTWEKRSRKVVSSSVVVVLQELTAHLHVSSVRSQVCQLRNAYAQSYLEMLQHEASWSHLVEFPKKGSCFWFCSGGNSSSSCGSVEVHLNCLSGPLGAPWQEATELMKALDTLLGNALYKNVAVKREMEQKVRGQDAVAVVPSLNSLAGESKSEEVEGQVRCRCLVGPSLTSLLVFPLARFFNSWAPFCPTGS